MAQITSANAHAMAELSKAARAMRRALGPALAQAAPVASGALDPYVKARLVRVRRQLNRLDEMVLNEVDAQKLDRLASAQARLSEQERILSGRPLPGSHKPTAPGKVRRGPSAEGPIGLAPGS